MTMSEYRSILDMTPAEMVAADSFHLDELNDEHGRCTIYEPPRYDEPYVIGADFAYGLEGRDYDAAVVWHAHDDPPRQVATLHGHWGERFDRPLYALLRYYNEAFLLGERQVGLPILRSIVRDYGHGWVYYEQDLKRRGKKMSDRLGWPKSGPRARDPLLRKQRLVIKDRNCIIRDPAIIAQMNQVPRFDRPDRKYQHGSLGDVLGHDLLEGRPGASRRADRGSAPKRRGQRRARRSGRGH